MATLATDIIARIERAVQRDEGGRGIADLIIPGELERAARELATARSVAILTGFPCMVEHTPPTETDGPSGALAIARACLGLGKDVHLLIDETNAAVLEAAVAASDLRTTQHPSRLRIHVFPCLTPDWGQGQAAADTDERLRAIAATVDAAVAIERAGPGRDGGYRTMRGRRMDHLVAPLERLFAMMEGLEKCTVGIGDGGNEVGMGKVEARVVASTVIPNARDICCVVPARWLVVSSVSNWGGYALAAALAVVVAEQQPSDTQLVDRLLVSSETERAVVEAAVAEGARDGITGEQKAWVDGMPLEASLTVLEGIRALVSGGGGGGGGGGSTGVL